jgi:CheY-like chemotaxis protein
MRPVRLLLVDDNEDNLEILKVFLSEKYAVTSYHSPAEVFAALDRVQPDVLVLDIGMSPIDGVQCLAAIRARPRHARTPAVAVTAFARDCERSAFLAAGFQAVVTKPIIDHANLIRAIDAVLEAAPPRHARRRRRGDEPVVGLAS